MSKKNTLSVIDEVSYIDEINKYLKDYQNTLKTNFDEKTIIINGSFICELMIQLLIKKENITINQNASLIETCRNNNLIPKECCEFLSIIIQYKNTINYTNELNESIIPFLNAFTYFIIWFDNFYKTKYYSFNHLNIKECYNTIKIIIIEKEKICPECGFQLLEDSNFCNNCGKSLKQHELPEFELYNDKNLKNMGSEDFLSYKRKTTEKIDNILKKLEEQNKLLIEILNKANIIDKKIDFMIKEITSLQSLTEEFIKNAKSDEEIDTIIKTYTDQCIKNIMKDYILISEDQNYQLEKRKLISSFEENSWNKLSDNSKTFIITSKIMYNKLIMMDEVIDYSGICVLITKALEVEINKRFFTNFIKYLDKKYNKNYSKYPTALLFKKTEPIYSNKITMGNIAFILCLKENSYDSKEEIKNNKEKLLEYCKNCVLSRFSYDEIEEIIYYYASSIEEIRLKYRNPSAHTNEIKRVDAEECIDLVLDIEKLLKRMLDSFDY